MEKSRLIISKLIITAVFVSFFVVLVGDVIHLWQHGQEIISYRLFQGEPKAYTSFFAIWRSAFSDSARGIIQLGLVFLLLGQIIRVALTGFLFAQEKDRFFTWVSVLILAILLYSLFGG